MVHTFPRLLVVLILAAAGLAGGFTAAASDGSGLSGHQHPTSRDSSADLTSSTASRWRTVEKDGVFWLANPNEPLFYSTGVNFLDGGKESIRSKERQAFYWGNFFPTMEAWRRAAGAQLVAWGFNTRGGWSDPSPDFNLALTVDLELGRNSKFHWFDPFSPEQERTTHAWADKLTAPYRNDPQLMGYYSDNEVGWWNSPLFVWYLGKGWDNYTKRTLWQLLYDHYEGSWDKLQTDWVPEGNLTGFEGLKQPNAKMKLRPGGYGIRVVDRFMHLYCRHYYKLMAEALRRAHPGALMLGDRLPLYYHQDAVLAMGDEVDVISTNYNVDVPDGWVAPYYFDGLRRLSKKPVLVTEFFFAAEENRSGNQNETARSKYPKPGHLMTVNTQEERAAGVMNAIRNFARFPNVVGTHWFQYCDEPFGGREDGEDYNMGLIDLANRPYAEVTEVFRAWNPKLAAIHRESGRPANAGRSSQGMTANLVHPTGANPPAEYAKSPGTLISPTQPAESRTQYAALATPHPSAVNSPYPVTQATMPIKPTDQSLMDWDKDKTRLLDFQTPPPYVPFGDVHLAWRPEGLYLAALANTYVDPEFLAYQGEFPLSETFQIHLLASTSGKPEHYVIHLIPQPNPLFPDGFEVKPHLYRYLGGQAAKQLPMEGKVQRIEKALPHVAVEAFFPAESFGVKQLYAGLKLQMNIQIVSYYREFIMSWAGTPQLHPTKLPETLREVVLVESKAGQ
jgi:hypothetical protein